MLISRNWLQSHFETELPSAEKIAETLMMHSFELEGIKEKNGDYIIDIDVLPNRAHDCLSYAGVAREYSVLTGYDLKKERYHYQDKISHNDTKISVVIESNEQCYRYMARTINNVTVTESPKWLKERMESIGQRSINNIVDLTNYVMFDVGNPIHVFDADKIDGGITIRNAHDGEQMKTLTGEGVELVMSDLVIVDDKGVLALAGVKGGTKAEVTKNTKNIILEVANFNPTTTRTTARRVKILTDSSKRFENAITSELAPIALEAISRLISNVLSTESLGIIVDNYPIKEESIKITVRHDHINRLLGLSLEVNEIEELLGRIDYQFHTENDSYLLTIPANRLDLRIPEDIIEELGRIYGYHNIPSKNVDEYKFTPAVNTLVFVENKIKNYLLSQGFSELKNYSFVKKGDYEMLNPIASDKRSLRKNLYKEILVVLEKNNNNRAFLGTEQTLIFEIGRTYTKKGEVDVCCIAIKNNGKKENKKYGIERVQLEKVLVDLGDLFDVTIDAEFEGNSVSFSIDQLHSSASSYNDMFSNNSYMPSALFHPISPFPYITRDISFWTSNSISEVELRTIIQGTDTRYLKKIFLFDRFENESKVSYAFSLVFQANKKTLTDEEVELDMFLIGKALQDNSCVLR
ncbi:MAG: phenylalanyl-tRNA synthetase beta chain [Crocinitomicaceae bacterium]|jgi:phenylalanyl-tRNA synthetase beta chain